VVEHLPSKHEALSSPPTPLEKKKERERKPVVESIADQQPRLLLFHCSCFMTGGAGVIKSGLLPDGYSFNGQF
jgi:hypothetical protein